MIFFQEYHIGNVLTGGVAERGCRLSTAHGLCQAAALTHPCTYTYLQTEFLDPILIRTKETEKKLSAVFSSSRIY